MNKVDKVMKVWMKILSIILVVVSIFSFPLLTGDESSIRENLTIIFGLILYLPIYYYAWFKKQD